MHDRRTTIRAVLAHAAIIAACCGCTKQPDREEPVQAAYVEFAEAIEESLNLGDPSLFDSSFDIEGLLIRTGAELELPRKVVVNVLEGWRKRAKETSIGVAMVSSVVEEDGSYELLGLSRTDGQISALYRTVGYDGLNYHELFLGMDESGKVAISDHLAYLSGERMTDTMRAVLAGVPRHTEPLPRGTKLPPEVKLQCMRIALDQASTRYLSEGNPQKALEAFDGVPVEMRADRMIQRKKILIAREVGAEEFAAAVAEFSTEHPRDPSLVMLMLDVHQGAGRYAEFLRALDVLDELVGGDSYLDTLRASAHLDMGSIEQAEKLARRAVAANPTLEQSHNQLLAILLEKQDYRGMVRALDDFEDKTGFELDSLEGEEVFEGFVQSAAYKMWIEKRRRGEQDGGERQDMP